MKGSPLIVVFCLEDDTVRELAYNRTLPLLDLLHHRFDVPQPTLVVDRVLHSMD